jgi:hypothetical protein
MIRHGSVLHHEQVCPSCYSRDIILSDTEWLDQGKKIKTLNVLFLCVPCGVYFSELFRYEDETIAKRLLHELSRWCLDQKFAENVKFHQVEDIVNWIR